MNRKIVTRFTINHMKLVKKINDMIITKIEYGVNYNALTTILAIKNDLQSEKF